MAECAVHSGSIMNQCWTRWYTLQNSVFSEKILSDYFKFSMDFIKILSTESCSRFCNKHIGYQIWNAWVHGWQ